MRPMILRFLSLMLALLLSIPCALAADQPPRADETLVKTLLPEYSMIDGNVEDGLMRLIVEKEDGTRVFIGGIQDQNGTWQLTESTPLPDGTILGVENFVTSLGIKGKEYYLTVTLSPFRDGTWGVTLLYPQGSEPMIFMGQNWIARENVRSDAVIGLHPWSDITTIDWSTLPASAEDAVPYSADDWAIVANPDPHDRLNLRTEPNTASRTLGKYYNGTPIRLLSGRSNGFVQVDILGVTGWMKEEFISYETSTAVIPMAGPQMQIKGESLRVYEAADTCANSIVMDGSDRSRFEVIGVVGDTWYHVWYPFLGFGGYVLQSDLWKGNG